MRRNSKLFICCVIYYFILSGALIGQPTQPNTPSAAVYNYSKYADVAPNLYTGAVSEFIPFGDMSAGPLSHSIGLSYYFAGHRPSDLSGPEGLGFHMLSGGAVTRQIRGIDDLDTYGWLETGIDFQDQASLTTTQMNDLILGELDPEGDIYSLQVGGMNIKFVMDHNGVCHTVPRSDIEISYIRIQVPTTPSYFLMVDTKGNRYLFGEEYNPTTQQTSYHTETTTFGSNTHTSAWYLYRIETHDQLHNISFDYEDHNYKFYTLQDCEIVRWKNGGSEGTVGNDCVMTAEEVSVNGQLLSSISGLAGSASFNYVSDRTDLLGNPKRLESLNISTGSFTKTYTFNHDYFSDNVLSLSQVSNHLGMTSAQHSAMAKKLRLTSIEVSGGDESIPSFEFDYYRPSHTTSGFYVAYSTVNKAIDAYGFANGKHGTNENNDKKYIIPSTLAQSGSTNITYGYSGDIRKSDGNFSVTSGLYKMTLPTGGEIIYTYEPNEYFDNTASEVTEGTNVVSHGTCGSSTNYDVSSLPFTFTQAQIDYGKIDWTYTPLCTNIPSRLEIYILQGNDTIDFRPYVNIAPSSGTLYLNTLNQPLMPNVSYTFQLKVNRGQGLGVLKYSTSGTDTEIGGMRLQNRTADDVDGVASNTIERSFVYKDSEGNSSGRRYKEPLFGYGLTVLGTTANAVFSTASIRPFTSYAGHFMGYEKATIDYHGNGSQSQLYHTDGNIITNPAFPPVPEENRSLWGQLEQTSMTNETGDVLKNDRSYINGIEYGFEVDADMFSARRLTLKTNSGTLENDFDTKYRINTGLFRPDSIVMTLEGISKTQNFAYGSSNHLQATTIGELFTNGEEYIHNLSFTVDDVASEQTDSLISRNIIIPNIDDFKMNGQIVKRTQTFFTVFPFINGNETIKHPWPSLTWRDYYDEQGNSIRETDQIITYNSQGLITAYRRHGYTIKDVFSYNANSLITSSGLEGLTKSYKYHTGSNLISEITEVDGTKTAFDYDGLMRLEKITDPVGATSQWAYEISKNVTGHDSYIKSTETFPADANNLSSLVSLETYSYLDGLGRTQQTVRKAQAFSGKDQVSAVIYDEQGRVDKSYETFATTVSTGAFSSLFINEPFTETIFETSPLNRPLSVTPPDFGTQEYTYGTNVSTVTGINNTSYLAGTLFERTVIDGNGNKARTYQDIQGRTVLKRRMDASETAISVLDTKMDYDWRNLLIEVIPPGSTVNMDALNFIYEHDNEGKTIKKKIPSKGWIDYVYDNRDLLIGYQDSFMAAQSEPWYIYEYDNWGRELRSGFHGSQPINGSTIPNTELTASIYGTLGIEKGKVTSTTATILGGTDKVSQTLNYDTFGRLSYTTSSNIYQPSVRNDRTDFFYDGASNVVKTEENVRLGIPVLNEETVTFETELDDDGRAIAEYITLMGLTRRQLCAKTYTDKNELAIHYQGGNNITHLQEMNYSYLDNQSLITINGATASGNDLYGYRINYTEGTDITGNTTQPIVPQLNGNINSILWAEQGQNTEYHNYRYDYLDRLLFDYTASDQYNTSYTYDTRGNFDVVTRRESGVLIDNLKYEYPNDNKNQLEEIIESSDDSKGYLKVNSQVYEYNGNGNLTVDPQKDISVVYNHLDLPKTITFSDNRVIECIYDGSGKMWSKILKNADGTELQRHNYIGSFETIKDKLYAVMHSEGRIVNQGLQNYLDYLYLDHQQRIDGVFEAQKVESTGNIIDQTTEYEASQEIVLNKGFNVEQNAIFDATIVSAPTYTPLWQYNWTIRDHLGNLKIEYTGPNISNLEALQTQDYFPYGMHVNKNLDTNLENKYAYNGIDHVGEFGLDWEMATFRSLDASIGSWLQIDPKAEWIPSQSPYSSMNNNPISNVDPDGDLPFLAVVGIGAATGIFGNGLSNVSNGQGFFDGAGKAALWGGIGAAASFGIGAAAGGIFGQGASFGKAAFQFGAHGLSNGLQSHIQGGSFGQGFLSGGIGSGISSGVHALGGGAGGQIFGGGLGGGIGSAISGGNFFQGMTQGLLVGGFNHALHSGLSGGQGDPPTKAELKQYLAGEFLNGSISRQEYINAIALVDDGPWGLFKQVASNNKYELAMTVLPVGRLGMLGRYFGSLEQLAGAGTVIARGAKIDDLPRLIAKYGGKASDWTKVVSNTTYKGRDGFRFSTHWYQKGSTRIEVKTVLGR